ncbi:MAG: 3-oxoacyl-ACP reductase [Clostridia bacterium BRH_c25]|nr:MAG: 3-oxoacyl-ACP reductase [Clostridia bacterium BRH_c25]
MKTVLVTGTSGDLGCAIARTLLAEAYRVIGLSRKTNSNVTLLETNPNYLHKEFDLIQTDRIKDLILGLQKSGERFDGLVNNAAFAYDEIVTNANLDQLNTSFSINVFSPIMLTKYIIRNMLLNKISGSIVNISSVSAHTGYKGLSMYAATKGALEAFSKNTAREWGSIGIRSNCVVPGFMETKMSDSLTSEQKNRIYKRTSLKKETSIDSVAETAAFLISDKAASITGQNIHVDNGTI